MAYKLNDREKEVANFIRGLNSNIEKSIKAFGEHAEITQNLISLGKQFNLQTVKNSKLGVQYSTSRKELERLTTKDYIQYKSMIDLYYTGKGKNKQIRNMFNVANRKAELTKKFKNQNIVDVHQEKLKRVHNENIKITNTKSKQYTIKSKKFKKSKSKVDYKALNEIHENINVVFDMYEQYIATGDIQDTKYDKWLDVLKNARDGTNLQQQIDKANNLYNSSTEIVKIGDKQYIMDKSTGELEELNQNDFLEILPF